MDSHFRFRAHSRADAQSDHLGHASERDTARQQANMVKNVADMVNLAEKACLDSMSVNPGPCSHMDPSQPAKLDICSGSLQWQREWAFRAVRQQLRSMAPLAVTQPVLVAPQSKAQAVLGGQVSALERIRAAQVSGDTMSQSLADGPKLSGIEPLAPASVGFNGSASQACINPAFARSPTPLNTPETGHMMPPIMALSLPTASIFTPPVLALKPLEFTQFVQPALPAQLAAPPARGSDLILGSKRVAIGKTQFDRNWARVKSESLGNVRRLGLPTFKAGQSTADKLATLRAINAWVNRRITYVEDAELFGRADYWAGARETLRIGKGDCEDFAITKMQLLARAGISRDDMILTIARDNVRRADHAVLMVKVGDERVMLDNATDALLDGSMPQDYRPILSFGTRQAWLHGY
jgi:predicted transglutaminase-like cysteine proteinase